VCGLPRVQGNYGCKSGGVDDLGMEAIYAFTVKDMPVSVAVDAQGTSVHITGPKLWQAKIEEQAIELF